MLSCKLMHIAKCQLSDMAFLYSAKEGPARLVVMLSTRIVVTSLFVVRIFRDIKEFNSFVLITESRIQKEIRKSVEIFKEEKRDCR